ncbi:MAG: sugar phosphate isomerase/epimerase [Candidatus Brockarchaeota archaeon]|nr:sugar phosphate isomerase/epimerase [Candidatus Brockarchaeota archaeon]
MKKGFSQLCLPGGSTVKEGISLAKKLGYAGLEILLTEKGELSMDSTERDYENLRSMSSENGVEYCSICANLPYETSLTSNNPEVRERGKKAVEKMLEAAAALGVNAVLVIPGRVTEQVPYDVAYERAQKEVSELASTAEKLGVAIALENVWNRMLLSPLEFREFIDAIGSKYVGAYFDTGNVVIFGYPEQWIDILGKRIRKVHFKDFKREGYRWAQLTEGDVNWKLVMGALRRAGYDDYVTSEVEGDYETFKQTSRIIDRILAM